MRVSGEGHLQITSWHEVAPGQQAAGIIDKTLQQIGIAPSCLHLAALLLMRNSPPAII